MVDDRGSDGAGGARVSSGQFNPAVLIALGGIGVLLGAVLYLLRQARTGDEPPIRVKGGSIKLELLSRRIKWKPDSFDGKHWKLSGGTRGKDDYTVVLVVKKDGGIQTSIHGGRKLVVSYARLMSQGGLEIKSTGRKTHVRCDHSPEGVKEDPPELMFDQTIQEISLDGQLIYSRAHGALDNVTLYDCAP